jgi:hypothetical protein
VEYGLSLQNLCLTLRSLGEYEKSYDGFLKALEIIKKFFGEDHVEFANTLQNLCGTL